MRELLFILFLFTTCLAMEEQPPLSVIATLTTAAPLTQVVIDTDKLNIDMHYNMALKCLNLSDITMGDEGLLLVFDQIKLFVLTNKVESLILENTGLTKIPYFAVSFALITPTLQYVSLMHNDFGIRSGSPKYDQQVSYLVEDASMHSDDSRANSPQASSEPITPRDSRLSTPSVPRRITRSSTGADIAVNKIQHLTQ